MENCSVSPKGLNAGRGSRVEGRELDEEEGLRRKSKDEGLLNTGRKASLTTSTGNAASGGME